MSDDIQRTLGKHGAQLESLEETLGSVAADVKSLIASENERKGSKKIVWMIAAGVGALASAVADAFTTHFLK